MPLRKSGRFPVRITNAVAPTFQTLSLQTLVEDRGASDTGVRTFDLWYTDGAPSIQPVAGAAKWYAAASGGTPITAVPGHSGEMLAEGTVAFTNTAFPGRGANSIPATALTATVTVTVPVVAADRNVYMEIEVNQP